MGQAATNHPLREWRKSKGWTLERAAREVGTSRQVWRDWEIGRRRPNPKFMKLVRDLTCGKVSADDFYSDAADRQLEAA